MDDKIKSALDAAGTAADYSARATYQRGYDAGVASVEAREWALGVQVVAQQERLRLAENLEWAARAVLVDLLQRAFADEDGTDEPWFIVPRDCLVSALAAWDDVPGMEP